jgi:hypothetical protein
MDNGKWELIDGPPDENYPVIARTFFCHEPDGTARRVQYYRRQYIAADGEMVTEITAPKAWGHAAT